MRCTQARQLFGAFWDDETTQAEREWLESHFQSCSRCHSEYEALARSLELLNTLPRIEPAPDLVENALARARRATPAPDRISASAPRWVPVTAAAAVLLIAGLIVLPGVMQNRSLSGLAPIAAQPPVQQPELIVSDGQPAGGPVAVLDRPATAPGASGALATLPDSLFDHSEDVEFILDPVTLKRGRAHTVSRLPHGVQGEPAIITF